MTTGRKLKKRVRAEMERTGESYQAVLNRFRNGPPEGPADPGPPEDGPQWSLPPGQEPGGEVRTLNASHPIVQVVAGVDLRVDALEADARKRAEDIQDRLVRKFNPR